MNGQLTYNDWMVGLIYDLKGTSDGKPSAAINRDDLSEYMECIFQTPVVRYFRLNDR